MLLTKKEVIKYDTKSYEILKHMGYSAYKLWNVGNYEKRNYKSLGMEQFPNWYDQKKRLKENFFYKNLPSQTAQDVLQLLQESWKSYFTLLSKKSIENPQPPRFKKSVMNITFLKDAIKQEGAITRLTIPKQLKDYLKTLGGDATYIYLKTKRFSNIPIKELQVKFLKNSSFLVIAVYETKEVPMKKENGRYLSIDLGIRNTFTCYDSEGKAFIIKGFLKATHYYDKKLAYYQGMNSSQQVKKGIKYPKPSKRILKLYQKRRNSVHDFLHKATRYITNYCVENQINTVVIGDITNIRKDKDIGRSNQQLHSLPYKVIYGLLDYKLRRFGITMVLKKESYSSQCPPDSPNVAKKYAVKTNRKYRGLYCYNGKIYNADCIGAYNILRLYLQEIKKDQIDYKNLSSPIKVAV